MSIQNFLIKNKAVLMLAGGVIGFVATNYLTAKGAVKRQKRLEEIDHDLTLGEEIKLAVECYGPAVACGTVSAGLIFGGNKSYAATQAGLVSAYTYLNTRFAKEKQAIVKTLGVESLFPVKEELKIPIKEEAEKRKPVSQGSILVCDESNGAPRYSEITMEQLIDAGYQINKKLTRNGVISKADYLELLGFDITLADEELGWNVTYLSDVSGDCWLDIYHDLIVLEDESYCYIIRYDAEPIAGFREF